MGWNYSGHKEQGMIHAICLGPRGREQTGERLGQLDCTQAREWKRGGEGRSTILSSLGLRPRPRSSSVCNVRGKEGRVMTLASFSFTDVGCGLSLFQCPRINCEKAFPISRSSDSCLLKFS